MYSEFLKEGTVMTSKNKPLVQVIIGSTRPNRVGPAIARWVYETSLNSNSDLSFELVDIKDYSLPLLDEPKLPAYGEYEQTHTKKWAAKISEANGYIFVVPEYNHGYAAATKNALDYLYAEWNNKPIAFVGYGAIGGLRAVEQLRQVIVQLQMIGLTKSIHIINPQKNIKDSIFLGTDDLNKRLIEINEDLKTWTSRLS